MADSGQDDDVLRVPGGVTAVSSKPGGISLFGLSIDRVVVSTFFEPATPDRGWAPWFPIHPEQTFEEFSPVSAVSSVPGGLSLFAITREGVVMSTFFDPRVKNPQWVPWFPIHPEQTFEGFLPFSVESGSVPSSIRAVSSVAGGVTLFATTRDGVVMSTFFDPRLPNPHWVPWFAIHPEQKFRPLTGITAVSSIAGGISLFAIDPNGVVKSTFFDPRLPNPQWVPWFAIHGEQTFTGVEGQGGAIFGSWISAVSSVQGGISLFAANRRGTIMSTFFDPRLPNPTWQPWFPIREEQQGFFGALAVSTIPGGISLFALRMSDSSICSTFFDPRSNNPNWGPWFAIHPEQQISGGYNAVSSIPGGVSLFGVRQDGVVMSTFFDPRSGNPHWVPWFEIHAEQKLINLLPVGPM